VIFTEEQYLKHIGTPRHSGRYPWGSGGEDSNIPRNRSFLDIIKEQRKSGMKDSEIAKFHGITMNQLRARRSIALAEQRQQKSLMAWRLKQKGYSNGAIGERMGGLNESSVRALLSYHERDNKDVIQTTANVLKEHVKEKTYLDIGRGTEAEMGINKTRFDTAVEVLKEQGYVVETIKLPQQFGAGKRTTTKVLAPPGTTFGDISKNRDKIQPITSYSEDQGRSFLGIQTPISVSSRRIGINYKEDGGDKADGVIYVRPGVKDLQIGSSRYAQVRVAVDGTHYLKGMAIYKDDLPDGVDLVFNTNKNDSGNKHDAMKELEPDENNPFGSIVRQVHDSKGKVSSAMNIVGPASKEGSGEEGDWDSWSRNISSQVLSKQSPKLAKQQLDLTFDRRMREFNEISSLTNPTVRKDLLNKFADETDSAAVHLKAAGLPRQATKVILPIASIKPHEIYAPTFKDGERVVLIRYPHGGKFEIPELTVNNRNREARNILGTGKDSPRHDSVGIHHSVAKHLSGADFDGDTVLVIPNPRKQIAREDPLDQLKDFDPMSYKIPDGSYLPRVTNSRKQAEMGNVSNLITDMTIKGASNDEISRAVRHSMVVIDSEKHQLNFKQSEMDHGIRQLKEKYQKGTFEGKTSSGAATLISRAKAKVYVPQKVERRASEGGKIDPLTGKKVFVPSGERVSVRKTITDPATGKKVQIETGETRPRLQRTKRLAETEDAFSLVSTPGTEIERTYAAHSNKLKALANQARKDAYVTKPNPTSPSAKKVYVNEVASLNSKLQVAVKNAPLERAAQRIATTLVTQAKQATPHMEDEEIKKVKRLAVDEGRRRTGAEKVRIKITQNEWNAIQAGAISNDKLEKILYNADTESVRVLALPKHAFKMTSSNRARAQTMLASGYTQAEVADALGVGLTTLKVSLSE